MQREFFQMHDKCKWQEMHKGTQDNGKTNWANNFSWTKCASEITAMGSHMPAGNDTRVASTGPDEFISVGPMATP